MEGGAPLEEGGHIENAGAADDDGHHDGRPQGFAKAPEEAGYHFDDKVQHFGAQNIGQPDIAQVNDVPVGAENGKEGPAQEKDKAAHRRHGTKALKEGDTKDFPAAGEKPGAVVLASEGGTGLSKGIDDVVGNDFQIEGCCRGGHHFCAQTVDGRLDDNVGKAENGALDAGRHAYGKDFLQHRPVESRFLQGQVDRKGGMGQKGKEHETAQKGGAHGGGRCAVCIHAHAQDEEQAGGHLHHAGKEKAQEGSPGVSLAPENGGGEVVHQYTRQGQEYDAQVAERQGPHFFRYGKKGHQGRCGQFPHCHHDKAAHEGRKDGGMYGPGHALPVLSAGELGNHHISTKGDADEEGHNDAYHGPIASHGGHGAFSYKAAHNEDIRCIKKLLADACHSQQQRKGPGFVCDGAMEHIHFLHCSSPFAIIYVRRRLFADAFIISSQSRNHEGVRNCPLFCKS